MMQKNMLASLQAVLQLWLALACGIVLTALFATALQAVGVSKNTSLLLAFILLTALILYGMSKAPWSFLQGKEGIPWERFFRLRAIARATAFNFFDRYTLSVKKRSLSLLIYLLIVHVIFFGVVIVFLGFEALLGALVTYFVAGYISKKILIMIYKNFHDSKTTVHSYNKAKQKKK
jgi:hypothetical protein